MNASLEATLRLKLAEYQAGMAAAQGESNKLRDLLEANGRRAAKALDPIAAAHKRLAEAGQRTRATFAAPVQNPWTTASVSAERYAQVMEQRVLPALQRQQQTAAATAAAPAFQPRQGEGADSNRMLWQQGMQERQAAAAASRGRTGGGGGQLAMMAMQAQDIAVQLQAGTKGAIVLAQQGSQLLSSFGRSGAIAGGVVAIGGAFYTMGQKAREAFEAAEAEAAKFEKDLRGKLAGSIADITQGVGSVDERMRGLNTELQGMMLSSGFMDQLAAIFGGPSIPEKAAQINRSIVAAREAQVKLGDQLLVQTQKELEISELRAQGEDEKADAMEREIALSREIARINAMPLPGNVRSELVDAATAKSGADAQGATIKKNKEDILRLEQQIREAALATLGPTERFFKLSQEQSAVFSGMATSGGLFFEQSLQGLEAWAAALRKTGDVAGLAKVLEMQQRALDLQKQMDAAKGEGDAVTEKDDASRQAAEEEQKKYDFEQLSRAEQIKKVQEDLAAAKGAESLANDAGSDGAKADAQIKRIALQRELNALLKEEADSARDAQEKREDAAAGAVKQHEAQRDIVKQIHEMQLRAAGRDDEADKLKKRNDLEADAQKIMEQTGSTYAQAMGAAQMMADLQEKISARKKGGDEKPQKPGHIGGVTRKTYMQSGLDEFERNQRRNVGVGVIGSLSGRRGPLADTGLSPSMLLADTSLSLTERARGNADRHQESARRNSGAAATLLANPSLSLTERARGNADRQDSARRNDNTTATLLAEQNKILNRGFFGA